jgi:hypothetical protein
MALTAFAIHAANTDGCRGGVECGAYLAFDGQPAPLIIIKHDAPLAELLYEHVALGAQVFDLLLLLFVDLASEYGQ